MTAVECRPFFGIRVARLHSTLSSVLNPIVGALVAAGVSANVMTAAALSVGMLSGLALALDHFAWAALGLFMACGGDALDGAVARRTQTASNAGALFDSSADRYQEFFAFGGLAMLFRTSKPALVLALLALVGAFMVSYGSAKAEGIGVPVPPGLMRRPERAVCLWVGVALVPLASWMRARFGLPLWIEHGPVVVAVAVIAVAANVSAITRLRAIASESQEGGAVREARELALCRKTSIVSTARRAPADSALARTATRSQ
jgi:CDP-diacylglycerol--glycerol-3-phosphate 3-phosphatidyltransferase